MESMLKPLDRRSFVKFAVLALGGSRAALASGSISSGPLATARERSLSFYNLHTAETLKTVYWADGNYIPEALTAINHHLRDYRTNEVKEIDRRLLDLLCELRLRVETTAHLDLISGYR